MKRAMKFALAGAAVMAAGVVGWRLASRRREIPCPSWLSWLLDTPYTGAVASTEAVLDRLELAPGMAVLDVGCGPGRLLVPAAQRIGPGGQAVGLDIQPAMLARAGKRIEAAGLGNVRLIEGGAGQGLVEANAFDRVILVTVLGEIPDREAALAEIYRALKPGGILSVTEVFPDPHFQRAGTVRRLALAAGFAERRFSGSSLAYTINLARPAAGSSGQ